MPDKTDKDIWAELRKPFDPKSISKLPKGNVTLDYVGHAAVTDRLNSVDPTWTWEPMAKDDYGNPLLIQTTDNFNKPLKGLWIRLTIGGVTRPGFGDGKTEKEAIGDALRNAAMRFGVALDLWSKDELESNLEHPENKNHKPSQDKTPATPLPPPEPPKTLPDTDRQLTEARDKLRALGVPSMISLRQALEDAKVHQLPLNQMNRLELAKVITWADKQLKDNVTTIE